MAKLCLQVILTTSFGLGVLCRERREFDCMWEIMGKDTWRVSDILPIGKLYSRTWHGQELNQK